MNAILLAAACAGALAVILTTDALPTGVSAYADKGSMTREVSVDPQTGETEETSVIAFLD